MLLNYWILKEKLHLLWILSSITLYSVTEEFKLVIQASTRLGCRLHPSDIMFTGVYVKVKCTKHGKLAFM